MGAISTHAPGSASEQVRGLILFGALALAVPAAAPWMKISEAMDYIFAIKPRRSFSTHEMLLSRAGKDLSNERFQNVTKLGGGEFFALEPGDSIDL